MSNNIIKVNNGMNTFEKEQDRGNNKSHKAFNNLLQLQLLIQKHSGLKELCK
jgi:hypothetical protein